MISSVFALQLFMQVSFNAIGQTNKKKSFLPILLLLSGDISLNPGPVYNKLK